MQVCFADVAQGSASVILLGNRRAAVIDCGGRQTRVVIDLLSRFRINTLVRLVVTHNHADHAAGAASLLTAFPRRIEQIWMLFDTVLQGSLFWTRVKEEEAAGRLSRAQLRRLERAADPQVVYREGDVILAVIAPDMLANLQAVEVGDPNGTSGVLLLQRGNQRVLFSGDSTMPEWRAIMSLDDRPFRCAAITVPHHGGKVWVPQGKKEPDAAYAERVRTDLDWLYTKAILARIGVVSVGSSNQHKHPRPEVLDALRNAGVLPICTQITTRCVVDMEGQRKRSLPVLHPGRSTLYPDHTNSGMSANVPCCGTVFIDIQEEVVVHRLAEHQAMVDGMPQIPQDRPLCRR